METKSPSCPPSAEARQEAAGRVLLTTLPVLLPGLMAKVMDPRHGAVVTLLGCVRSSEGGLPIGSITYEAYAEMAKKEIASIVAEAEARFPVRAAVQHRVGPVHAGEPSVAVACAGPHRREAFDACRFVIDEIKARAPIWKVGFEWLKD